MDARAKRGPDRERTPLMGESGMTLTELLVASALMTIVLAAAYLLLGSASGMADFAEAQARVAEETRLGMDKMTQEVRQASELPGQQGMGVFGSVPATGQISIYVDADHDGQMERVTYQRSGAQLVRAVTEPTIVDGEYTFGAAGAGRPLLRGLPADWKEPIFTVSLRGSTLTTISASQVASASAVVVHVRNSVTVNRRTAFAEDSTWVKIRSVENEVN